MRTTVDLPDELYRQVKARAALQGMKLREFVEAALREALYGWARPGEVRESEVAFAPDVSALAEDCVLPLILGETTAELRAIDGHRIDEILTEGDEADAELPSRR